MRSESELQALRAKILGASIREYRLVSGESITSCAKFLSIQDDEFEAFELGKQSPSLPQLESIALFLQVPVENLMFSATPDRKEEKVINNQSPILFNVRNRIIGAKIKQARLDKKFSIDELSQLAMMVPAEIEAIELGKKPISFPQLESVSRVLDLTLSDFLDKEEATVEASPHPQVEPDYMELSEDLRQFLSKPENRPYLELAMRLSEISTVKLRSIAEAILEITY